jgi:cell division protein FtsB
MARKTRRTRRRDTPSEDERVIDINEVRDEKRARRSFITGRRLVFFAIAVTIAVLVAVPLREIQELRREADAAKSELQLKEEQKANLEAELAKLHDPKYIEQQARDRLRMVKKDEIIYIYKNKPQGDSVDSAEKDKEKAAE